MIEFAEARQIAELLAAIAEPTRLQILRQLTGGPQYVGQLSEQLGIPMVNMSHHLGVMRSAGVLAADKTGRRVIYSLRPEVYAPGGAPDAIGVLTFGPYRVFLLRSASGVLLEGGRKRAPRKKPADVPAGE
jgi:DNA-binding transcriptional ArsR family regulator